MRISLDDKPPRFRALFNAAAENRLTDAEHEEWNTLLQTDPDARRAYLHLANLHATLHQRLAPAEFVQPLDLHSAVTTLLEPTPQSPAPAAAASPSPRRPFRFRTHFWPAAATILFAVTLLLAYTQLHTATTPKIIAKTPATITGLTNIAWEDPGLTLHLHDALPAQRLRLRAGLLRLQLPTGTTVIIQGPAQFQVAPNSNFHLDRGNLTAHVPPKGAGFTVNTPNAAVTDLGTEFGIYVNRDDQTHAEVFVGKVRVSAATDSGASSSRIVEAGNAVRIADESTGIEPAPLEPLAFIRPDRFDEISRTAPDLAFARWLVSSRELQRDPTLLAYYNFEPAADKTQLLNLAAATTGHANGAIDNARWDEGRFPGKHALRFNGQSSVHVQIPQTLSSVTLVAWVNPENLADMRNARLHQNRDGAYAGILLSNGARPAAVHWQFMEGARTELGLGVSDAPTVPFDRYRSLDALSSHEDGRWVFMALTIDSRTQRIRHFLDGALVGNNHIVPRDIQPVIGDAEIGNWNPVTRKDHPLRGLKGRIDELAIFNRALSEQEIQSLFAAGSGG